jgi:DNA adenine methylase
MTKFQPVIKWSGSKRSQAEEILKRFPKKIDTYYEPFCGSASMLRALLESDIEVREYCCSDLNDGLIALWNMIKYNPLKIKESYRNMWNELNVNDDKERKKQYFYTVRERYNMFHKPEDFMFIMRTTTNGMPRYNKDGLFNNSFHVTRNGIIPDTLDKIVDEWSSLLNRHNVSFTCHSYNTIDPYEGDFVYLDPPYANTKGMYYGSIDNNELWNWIRGLSCGYALSYDGISGEKDNTYLVPSDIYDTHEYILSGNSSFKRTIGKSNDSIVYESLYVKL